MFTTLCVAQNPSNRWNVTQYNAFRYPTLTVPLSIYGYRTMPWDRISALPKAQLARSTQLAKRGKLDQTTESVAGRNAVNRFKPQRPRLPHSATRITANDSTIEHFTTNTRTTQSQISRQTQEHAQHSPHTASSPYKNNYCHTP